METDPAEILAESLMDLIGAFHGPESHLSGDAPLDPHYNAGAVKLSGEKPVNTHVYFD